VTRGVDVTVNAFYQHSRVKSYLKCGKAFRIGRVAPAPCGAGAPSGPRMHVPAHAAQASR
ncbi:MAG: hypothetical protein LC808_05205, partial [Actinobacteria bacterium]|nr:hypothetical protein [Actinomycetota bacterium]